MDYSFFDAPRQPPVPTTIKKIERTPVVPEVSIIDNCLIPQPKAAPPHNFATEIKPPRDSLSNSDFYLHNKKHVRFKNGCPHIHPGGKENNRVPDLNGKTFKQIYMANVPDRHLDLSVFETAAIPQPVHKEIENNVVKTVSLDDYPTDYASFKRTQFNPQALRSIENKNDSFDAVRRFYNNSTESSRNVEINRPKSPQLYQNNQEIATNAGLFRKTQESCNEIAKPSDEPTIKDLFKIIQQQNEQIMMLQRQVNNLKSSIRQPEPEPVAFNNVPDFPFLKEARTSPAKKGLFSIDFQTTSFEVSFRPPHGKFRKQSDFVEPRIEEVVECDGSKENQDVSLRLEESLNVRDSYVSAVPSIQINMDEYQSSDEDEFPPVNNIGMTFYKDLMDQVNNVLKKMQVQSECQTIPNKKKMTECTMTDVKQATLQHLKSIGVNLTPIQETNEISGESDCEAKSCSPSEVSFAVKQLLMKYLPDDKLTQALNKQKETPVEVNLKEKKRFKPAGSEFSFATLQYLKKYNIIDKNKFPEWEKKTAQVKDTPKILDVTALKRQPKLL